MSGGRRVVRWVSTFGAAILVGYFVVLSIGAALWITGKPRVAGAFLRGAARERHAPHADGVRLAAWYVPSRNGAAIVLVHGGGGDRDGLKLHAALLARHGYGVLLYDERGRGASGGRSNAFGWDWAADVEASVDFSSDAAYGMSAFSASRPVPRSRSPPPPRSAHRGGRRRRCGSEDAGRLRAHERRRRCGQPSVLGRDDDRRPRDPAHDASAAARRARAADRAAAAAARAEQRQRRDVARAGVGEDRRTQGRPVARRRRAHEGPRRSPAAYGRRVVGLFDRALLGS